MRVCNYSLFFDVSKKPAIKVLKPLDQDLKQVPMRIPSDNEISLKQPSSIIGKKIRHHAREKRKYKKPYRRRYREKLTNAND